MSTTWTAELVIDRLDRAGATLLALPHTGYSTRLSQSRLAVVQDYAEVGFEEGEAMPTPSARQVSEMEVVLGWIQMIARDRAVLRRIVGARSLCRPSTMRPVFSWRRIAMMVGASHEAVRGWHFQGIDLIVLGLNKPGLCQAADGLIGPGPGLIRRQMERARVAGGQSTGSAPGPRRDLVEA